jgi:hypothetical protein
MHASRASRLTPVAAKKFLRSVVSRAYGLSLWFSGSDCGGMPEEHAVHPVSDDLRNYASRDRIRTADVCQKYVATRSVHKCFSVHYLDCSFFF